MKKKYCITIVSLIITVMLFVVTVNADGKVYNWYCVHRKDHLQPQIGSELKFIEKYDGIYIDNKHGDKCDDKVVYLTFDAGYENGNVEKNLNVLKEKNVNGAFFVLGNLIEKNTQLVLRMFDEGHLVCNHTYSHKSMANKSQSEIKAELEHLEKTCYELTGHNIDKYYRPPEGKFDEDSLLCVKNLGYKTVFWSFAYADWDNGKQMSCDKAKSKILDNVHNGAIILLHPTSKTNASILGEVIDELKSQGYRFGTLDELFENQ